MTKTTSTPRWVKLNIWAGAFLLVALIASNLLMNDGGWPWLVVFLAGVVGFIGFFLWSAKVQNRG